MLQDFVHPRAFAAAAEEFFLKPFESGEFCGNLGGIFARVVVMFPSAIRLSTELTLSPPNMPSSPPDVRLNRDGRREVVGQPFLLLFGGRVEQPHQQEEGHHGGHEVRIGDFPCATMVPATSNHFLAFDDQRPVRACIAMSPPTPYPVRG